MKYPIPNPSGNQMLSLINGLYQRSAGFVQPAVAHREGEESEQKN